MFDLLVDVYDAKRVFPRVKTRYLRYDGTVGVYGCIGEDPHLYLGRDGGVLGGEGVDSGGDNDDIVAAQFFLHVGGHGEDQAVVHIQEEPENAPDLLTGVGDVYVAAP